jgi:uncharacterized protein (TIGR02996 family)
MTERELLAAISASPDDDEPRLAYAKFIATDDPAYSEFIRLQIDRARDERARMAPRGTPSQREIDLRRSNGPDWARYLTKLVRRSPVNPSDSMDQGYEFDRGFISYVRIEPENFVALGARLFEIAPVQHVDFCTGETPTGLSFLDAPGLARLDSVSLAGSALDDQDAVALSRCEGLRRCSWVDLSNNRIGRDGIEALARSSVFQSKVWVDTKGNPCDPFEAINVDWDGSIASGTMPAAAREIETALGRTVGWFHFRWDRLSDVPDRFHAKLFV